MTSTESDWRTVEPHVRTLAADSLLALVEALYEQGPRNRAVVRQHVGLAVDRDPRRWKAAHSKVRAYVSPGPDEDFQLEAAVDVIDHYEESTGDRAGAIELMVYFLECACLALQAYGDLFTEFYDAVSDVAHRCSDALADEPALLKALRPRLDAVVAGAAPDGHCADLLHEALCQLESDGDDE